MASFKLLVAFCLVAAALSDQAPFYGHPSSPYKEDPVSPPKYSYNYGVADGYSGANYGHGESRDGYKTEGSYTVDLPDGRTQIVTYVDNGDGFIADVTYKGEAVYPDEPSYQPAPYAK
ncbi:unnamed protein product [Meganyctiphanes norvegica]|uniref:Cuticle protein n=1 Tax=Meganyctiphanes norvegica TaxID=48144 RepID=A0AAV2R754_MEGNR